MEALLDRISNSSQWLEEEFEIELYIELGYILTKVNEALGLWQGTLLSQSGERVKKIEDFLQCKRF